MTYLQETVWIFQYIIRSFFFGLFPSIKIIHKASIRANYGNKPYKWNMEKFDYTTFYIVRIVALHSFMVSKQYFFPTIAFLQDTYSNYAVRDSYVVCFGIFLEKNSWNKNWYVIRQCPQKLDTKLFGGTSFVDIGQLLQV